MTRGVKHNHPVVIEQERAMLKRGYISAHRLAEKLGISVATVYRRCNDATYRFVLFTNRKYVEITSVVEASPTVMAKSVEDDLRRVD